MGDKKYKIISMVAAIIYSALVFTFALPLLELKVTGKEEIPYYILIGLVITLAVLTLSFIEKKRRLKHTLLKEKIISIDYRSNRILNIIFGITLVYVLIATCFYAIYPSTRFSEYLLVIGYAILSIDLTIYNIILRRSISLNE